jgi:hypothetical protein
MTDRSRTSPLPPDIGQLDADTLELLRGTIGHNLHCELVDGIIRLNEPDPAQRVVARGAVFTAAPRPGRTGTGTAPMRFWLRPALLPEASDYAILPLRASRDMPASLASNDSVPAPRLGARLATSLESVVTVSRVEIFSERRKVAYADGDGDIGSFDVDSRIDFVGSLLNRTFILSVRAGPSDSGWLSLQPVGPNSASPPDGLSRRLVIEGKGAG